MNIKNIDLKIAELTAQREVAVQKAAERATAQAVERAEKCWVLSDGKWVFVKPTPEYIWGVKFDTEKVEFEVLGTIPSEIVEIPTCFKKGVNYALKSAGFKGVYGEYILRRA